MLFDVPLVDILPLIKCKSEAETIVYMKINLLKLGHLLDAFQAEEAHRQTLSNLCDMTAKASYTESSSMEAASSPLPTSTARFATLHCILRSALTTTTPGKDNTALKEAIRRILEGLFHVEVSF